MAQDYDPRWVAAFKMISDGVFGDVDYFEDLVASVNQIPERGNDWFLLANDFATYMDAQVRLCTQLMSTLRSATSLSNHFVVLCGGQ